MSTRDAHPELHMLYSSPGWGLGLHHIFSQVCTFILQAANLRRRFILNYCGFPPSFCTTKQKDLFKIDYSHLKYKSNPNPKWHVKVPLHICDKMHVQEAYNKEQKYVRRRIQWGTEKWIMHYSRHHTCRPSTGHYSIYLNDAFMYSRMQYLVQQPLGKPQHCSDSHLINQTGSLSSRHVTSCKVLLWYYYFVCFPEGCDVMNVTGVR